MSAQELRILMVEDVQTDAELEVRELKRAGLHVVHRLVDTEKAFREGLREFEPRIIISDFSMPHFDGMHALALARELAPDVPFIFVSGTIGEEYAIRALKSGAADYVLKNNLVRLPAAVERAVRDSEESAERRKAEAALREANERHRATFEYSPIGIMHTGIDADRILLVNPRLIELLGHTRDELLGMKTDDLLHPDHRGMDHGKYREKMLRGELNAFSSERTFVRKDGSVVWVNRTISLVRDAAGNPLYFVRMVEDITERKNQELRISRLNRIREVLSGINSAIVRIRDRQQLFEEACRIVVEHGKFTMSWIGMLDETAQAIIPVARMGRDEGYLERLNLTIASEKTGNLAMAVEAIGRRAPMVCNDIATDGRMRPWRAAALERGYRSSMTFPLMLKQQAVGVFVLYAPVPGFFDEEEMKLLTDLAGDISFALEHIAGQERIEKLTRIRLISSEINSAIVRIRDRQDLFNETCRIAVEHGNFGIAWIGRMDPKTLEVVPMACAGVEAESFIATSPNTTRTDSPLGQGIVGRAIREKRAVFSNDITAERSQGGARRQEAIRRGYRSLISFPLIVEDEVMGSLSLFAKEANFFDDEEIRLLTELAGNVSFALEHIAKAENIEKISRIRAVSSEINAAIIRVRERKALLDETCRIALEQGKFEMVWIGTVDAVKQEIRAAAWTGFSSEIANRVSWKSVTAAHGTLDEAIRTRKPAVRNDIEAELPVGGMRGEALRRGCRSTVCLPLVVDDKVAGLIALFAAGSGFFDADELALLDEVAADISYALQSISRQEELEYLSYYDTLTGLPNRQLFMDRLSQQMRGRGGESRMVALILFDIARFRNMNDMLGRHGGDDLLKQVARRLEHAFNGKDYLAHVFADVFGVVVRGVREAAELAHSVENLILAQFKKPFEVNGKELRAEARAGVALHPADGGDADTLFKNAEAALKKAKASSERYLFYAPQMNARVAEQLRLENDLRDATAQEQYVLHYQPRFDLVSGRISGMEALIRWVHPERGMVSPGEFVPLLEETGMIIEVGRWVLRRAALEYAAWSAAGLKPPRIAVNVSPAQLRRKDFVEYTRDALAIVDNAAQRIDIEITEGMLMEDIQGSIEKLKAVQALGLNVAIDDFGTGYSSLSYLARLPINSLKIDRSFIIQMPKSPEQMAIVSTVISLARALNFKVVAEGVETEEQANLLRLLRCDEVQGYLFARPLPPEGMEKLLREKGGTA